MPTDEFTLTLAFNASISLPVPTPLPEAIEAGLFGRDAAEDYQPSQYEVASIVRQHLNDVLNLTHQLQGYEAAMATGRHPESGRQGRSESQRATNRRQATELWKQATIRLLALYNAYEEAFGNEARVAFHRVVVELAATEPRSTQPEYQQELF